MDTLVGVSRSLIEELTGSQDVPKFPAKQCKVLPGRIPARNQDGKFAC